MDEFDYKESKVQEIDDDSDPAKDGFMEGYLDDEKVHECAECGSAIRDKGIQKEIDSEKLIFCSQICVEEYEESLS